MRQGYIVSQANTNLHESTDQVNDNSSTAPPVIAGLDVHKESITVALARCEGESRSVSVLDRGDLRHFPNAGSFMTYRGLTPSECSSGGRQQTGATTTGDGAIRRLLTESAWTYRFPARETHHIQRKTENAFDYAKERATSRVLG